MKRWFAALLALALLWGVGLASLAEEKSAILQWPDFEEQTGNNGIHGAFHFLADTGMMLWLPDFLDAYENSDVQTDENGVNTIGLYLSEDGRLYIHVTKIEAEEGATLASLQDALPGFGITLFDRITVNGMDAITYQAEEGVQTYLILEYAPGKLMQFVFYPASLEETSALFRIITASIQPEDIDVVTRYWQGSILVTE